MPFCIVLSAMQVYRNQTLRQKYDSLQGYRRLPLKDGLCRFGLYGTSFGFNVCENVVVDALKSGFSCSYTSNMLVRILYAIERILLTL